MSTDTFTSLWNRLLLRCPMVGPVFAQDIVKDAFKAVAERRNWSWRQKSGVLYPQSFSCPGTVSVTPNSAVVTGTGTSFDQSLIGSQFRAYNVGSAFPTYTIVQTPSSTSLVLDRPWVGPTASGITYQLFQCYFPMPADFNNFTSLVNISANVQLYTNITQQTLDRFDPQRTQYGLAYSAAFLDYANSFTGTVGDILQVYGSGAVPVATTTLGYLYPVASTYIITITTGGTVGTAEFTWRQDSGSTSTAITTSSDLIDLSNGVQIYFPAGTYVSGNIFIVNCSPVTTQSSPRYELWPRPVNIPANNASQYVYPYTYQTNIPDLSDSTPNLPTSIASRGDVILELALMKCAEFPGILNADSSETLTNPYYDLNLARRHQTKYEVMVNELEQRDEDINMIDLQYTRLPFYPAPWLDGSFQQSHDIMPVGSY